MSAPVAHLTMPLHTPYSVPWAPAAGPLPVAGLRYPGPLAHKTVTLRSRSYYAPAHLHARSVPLLLLPPQGCCLFKAYTTQHQSSPLSLATPPACTYVIDDVSGPSCFPLLQGRCLFQAYFNKTMKLVVSDKQKSVAFTAAWSPDGTSPPAVSGYSVTYTTVA